MPSKVSIFFLVSIPPRAEKPVNFPFLDNTLWQGTNNNIGFLPQALPIALGDVLSILASLR